MFKACKSLAPFLFPLFPITQPAGITIKETTSSNCTSFSSVTNELKNGNSIKTVKNKNQIIREITDNEKHFIDKDLIKIKKKDHTKETNEKISNPILNRNDNIKLNNFCNENSLTSNSDNSCIIKTNEIIVNKSDSSIENSFNNDSL